MQLVRILQYFQTISKLRVISYSQSQHQSEQV